MAVHEQTQRQMVKAIRAEHLAETGEDPGAGAAAAILDQMCEAFFHKFTGAGADYAVAEQPDTAGYLVWVWTGEDRKALRAAITRYNEREANMVAAQVAAQAGPHCQQCGSTDHEDLTTGDQGYSACCNEPVVTA